MLVILTPPPPIEKGPFVNVPMLFFLFSSLLSSLLSLSATVAVTQLRPGGKIQGLSDMGGEGSSVHLFSSLATLPHQSSSSVTTCYTPCHLAPQTPHLVPCFPLALSSLHASTDSRRSLLPRGARSSQRPPLTMTSREVGHLGLGIIGHSSRRWRRWGNLRYRPSLTAPAILFRVILPQPPTEFASASCIPPSYQRLGMKFPKLRARCLVANMDKYGERSRRQKVGEGKECHQHKRVVNPCSTTIVPRRVIDGGLQLLYNPLPTVCWSAVGVSVSLCLGTSGCGQAQGAQNWSPISLPPLSSTSAPHKLVGKGSMPYWQRSVLGLEYVEAQREGKRGDFSDVRPLLFLIFFVECDATHDKIAIKIISRLELNQFWELRESMYPVLRLREEILVVCMVHYFFF